MRNTWSVRPIWFMCHQRNRHGRFTLCIVPSSTSLRIPKDKGRRTIEQGENWLCLKDVSRGEQNHSNESHRDDGKRAAVRLRGFLALTVRILICSSWSMTAPCSEFRQKITCDKTSCFWSGFVRQELITIDVAVLRMTTCRNHSPRGTVRKVGKGEGESD